MAYFTTGSMAHRGDLVSCKVLFNRVTARGGFPVVFSLNGNDLDLGGEELEVKPNGKGEVPLHPCISMGHKGISILFKVSTNTRFYHMARENTNFIFKRLRPCYARQIFSLTCNAMPLQSKLQRKHGV